MRRTRGRLPAGSASRFRRGILSLALGALAGGCSDSTGPGDSGSPIPPVGLVDSPLLVTPQDPYALLEATLTGDILTLRVGFSGCSPDHRFTLYAGRYFQESIPVQTPLVLSHDALGESCEAYFERTLRFDLDPIRLAHIRDYRGPGVVILRFHDAQGGMRS